MKGQGLSINLVIIAVIGLIVMVILIAVFSGNIGKTEKGLAACSTIGGVCADSKPAGDYSYVFGKTCSTKDLDESGAFIKEILVEGKNLKCYRQG